MIRWASESVVETRNASRYINQCAWCGAMGIRGGYDNEKRPVISKVGSQLVSHGICPACYDTVLASKTGQAS
jgi:hypothetical protein